MYIVMVAAECAPVAKTGGLGDVVFGLSRELEIRGHEVEIVVPKYACMRYGEIWGLTPSCFDLWVPWGSGAIPCTVWFGHVHGRKCHFIEPHTAGNFFGRDRLYGFADDIERFAFFSKAALEFLLQAGKRPDVIHCHDWQTGLVPVLLYEQYREVLPYQRVCYTIHNFRHQGISGPEPLWGTQLGRPEYFLDRDRLGDDTHFRAAAVSSTGSTTMCGTRRSTRSSRRAIRSGISTPSTRIRKRCGSGFGCVRPGARSLPM